MRSRADFRNRYVLSNGVIKSTHSADVPFPVKFYAHAKCIAKGNSVNSFRTLHSARVKYLN